MFDKLVYVGVGDSSESRLSVLKAVTHKLTLGDDVDFIKLVSFIEFEHILILVHIMSLRLVIILHCI